MGLTSDDEQVDHEEDGIRDRPRCLVGSEMCIRDRRLAVGYTLDEIVNDITKATPACFEPTIDYCVCLLYTSDAADESRYV